MMDQFGRDLESYLGFLFFVGAAAAVWSVAATILLVLCWTGVL